MLILGMVTIGGTLDPQEEGRGKGLRGGKAAHIMVTSRKGEEEGAEEETGHTSSDPPPLLTALSATELTDTPSPDTIVKSPAFEHMEI